MLNFNFALQRKFKSLATTLLVLQLSACSPYPSTPQTPWSEIRFNDAKSAISQGNNTRAYDLLEDLFGHSDSSIRNSAIELARSNPTVIASGNEYLSNKIVSAATEFSEADFSSPDNFRAAVMSHKSIQIRFNNYRLINPSLNEGRIVDSVYATRLPEIRQLIEKRDLPRKYAEAGELARKNAATQDKIKLMAAKRNAVIHCLTKEECEKAFALTQIYVSEYSDMKIQVATGTIIETYNPSEDGKIGMKATKIPSIGTTADIFITANCKDEKSFFNELCSMKLLMIFESFPDFVNSRLR